MTRWNGLFLGTYLVTDLGGHPIANQFVGVAMFAPMLLGTWVAGSLRRGLDARKLVLVTEFVLLPVSVVMTLLVSTGAVQTWMVYPFELAYGFGGMVNMTAQRELLLRIGGEARATRVLNAEVTGMASAMMAGPLLGGLSVGAFGLGAAFAVPAVLLAGSVPLLWLSTRRMPEGAGDPTITPVPQANWRLLRRSRALVVTLLVTVICNLCYFAFIPLVPVIAQRLGAGASLTGVIGSMAGLVQLVVAAALVLRPSRRPLAAFAVGVALCLVGLGVLAYTPLVSVALLALGVAGVGQGLFGSTQATLPVSAVAPDDRAAAFGLLTTTIGVALPTGMVVLGVTSSLLGPQRAMLVTALAGLVVLGATVLLNRRVLGLPASGGAVGGGGERHPVAAQPELR
ncbi:MFS transporter [Mycolicibacterium baixiangningiae]|uniref:MFS transporter n=1 Tax=Mycolicibacterium baixiangningiae TaxID=2761578 RepID=UPI0018D032B4|nr:MFS transporter [Mycolicibacterium baixiangningiae]